jgi:acyl-ACP thioesterase
MRAHGRTELVGPPAAGRVFEQLARAGFADCAPSGRIRLDGLARWLQDIAFADVDDAGLAEVAVWVVRWTRIRVTRFPRFGERYSLMTFCSGLGRMWAERRTTVRREGEAEADVEAVSLWVHLDPASWRPVPFSDWELDVYGAAAAQRQVSARLRHPGPPADGPRSAWNFRATELDIASHVNNSAYWQPFEEEILRGLDPQTIDVEIEYRSPSQPGEKLVVGDGSPLQEGARRWILDGEGSAIASILITGLSVA